MTRFLIKIGFFLLPVVALFAFPAGIVVLAREYYSPQAAVATQVRDPSALYSMSYASSYAPYKETLVAERQPAVVAVGASRALPFRDFFFKDPEQFVNIGLPGASLDEVQTSLETILKNNTSIQVMILSLDPEDFDPAFTHQPESSDNIGAWYRTGWRDAYMRYTEGAYTLSDLYERARTTHHMGLPALVHGDGMRFDGSYQYHHILSDPNHNKEIARQITELVEKINTGRTIHFGQATSPQTLQKLADLLVLCKAHNIYVVGFLPPFPHEMYEAMMSKDDAYSDTIKTLPKKLEQLFVAQGYGFYNFTDSALVGGKDYEYTDAGHGSDKLYARMSLYLAQHDPVLRLRIHSDVLKKMIAASTGAAL